MGWSVCTSIVVIQSVLHIFWCQSITKSQKVQQQTKRGCSEFNWERAHMSGKSLRLDFSFCVHVFGQHFGLSLWRQTKFLRTSFYGSLWRSWTFLRALRISLRPAAKHFLQQICPHLVDTWLSLPLLWHLLKYHQPPECSWMKTWGEVTQTTLMDRVHCFPPPWSSSMTAGTLWKALGDS